MSNADLPALENGVNPEMVEMAERLVDEAKAGKIIAAAFVFVRPDRLPSSGWVNAHDTTDRLASGLLTLSWRYGEACNRD